MRNAISCGFILAAVLFCAVPATVRAEGTSALRADQLKWRLTRYCRIVG